MNRLRITAVLLISICCLQLTSCVPVALKDAAKITSKESDDPCDLVGLGNLPKCEVDNKDCESSNEQKLLKRKVLCADHPNCSYCESSFAGEFADEETEVVQPEIVAPIFENAFSNSTDDDDSGETPNLLPPDEIRAPPQKLIERNIIIENDNETQYYRGFIESAANITTIIRLTNLINNTNIVNMPTTLNNTNINNIHIYQNKTGEEGGKYGLGFTDKGPCCLMVEAKNCKRSTSGTKCRHNKQKVCGRQCTSKVIHPQKNPCTYSPQWPYNACPPPQFQPGFNPGFYPPPQFPPGFYPGPQNPPSDSGEFDVDDDLPLFPDDDLLENPESGWVVGSEKCKVVSEDGLQIVNCTQKGLEFEHPFARNTVNEPTAVKREARHASNPMSNQMMQPQMMQPQMYYPVMYQPVYLQPVYMPQYYAQPPPMGFYQPQQIPLPPTDSYYEKDLDVISYQQPKKVGRKRHPVVVEVDDEL